MSNSIKEFLAQYASTDTGPSVCVIYASNIFFSYHKCTKLPTHADFAPGHSIKCIHAADGAVVFESYLRNNSVQRVLSKFLVGPDPESGHTVADCVQKFTTIATSNVILAAVIDSGIAFLPSLYNSPEGTFVQSTTTTTAPCMQIIDDQILRYEPCVGYSAQGADNMQSAIQDLTYARKEQALRDFMGALSERLIEFTIKK